MSTLVIPRRYRGPARSGNGGWSAGALAALTGSAEVVEVTLRLPPPLDTPMEVVEADSAWTAYDGESAVLTARASSDSLTSVAAVDRETAGAAEARFAGLGWHAYPTCFVCGPDVADGLRLAPGPFDDTRPELTACTWTPGESDVPLTWAALDCPSIWGADLRADPVILGRMRARIDALPRVGEPHVVVGEVRGGEGRKVTAASSIYDSDGALLATAEQTWVRVDHTRFN